MTSLLAKRHPISRVNLRYLKEEVLPEWEHRRMPTTRYVVLVNGGLRLITHLERDAEYEARHLLTSYCWDGSKEGRAPPSYDIAVVQVLPNGVLIDWVSKIE